ncbi:amidohydrolase [Colletotrichum karsti]|uniref:Amidohydrolase n=1 Tax=Colletotrichum karsti TaxID=1095194 RepID=A0A9P6I9E2_9PEZI|nr:amidohydrolase [Colletotrichum karsti]KAF9878394.1 amidohydrolase [Colletotrichum karsti]
MALVLRAHRLLLDSAAEVIQNGAVIVSGDRIQDAGSWTDLRNRLLSDATVQDLGDVTLMPGLFDCHVHLSMDPSSLNATTDSNLSEPEMLDLMTLNASKLLDAGVTTARDLGSPGVVGAIIRDLIAAGEIEGPRLQVAHAPITVPGGHACAMGGEAEGVDGVRAEVIKRAAEGANLVKVMSTGGFMTAGTHPGKARYSLEQLKAIVEEAHKHGMPVTTHATGTEGIERAVDARLDSIEHCAWISGDNTHFEQNIAKKMVEYDIAVCPTMNTACVEHNYFCPWDSRKAIVSNLTQLRSAGVKMIVGTDAGIPLCRFERYFDGLTVLADAGYTVREIIASATSIPASICGLANETGRIASGFSADLAAFEGDVLGKGGVLAFGKPKFVMARGQVHKLQEITEVGDVAKQAQDTVRALRKGAGLPDIL